MALDAQKMEVLGKVKSLPLAGSKNSKVKSKNSKNIKSLRFEI